jgi:hypothetical protein
VVDRASIAREHAMGRESTRSDEQQSGPHGLMCSRMEQRWRRRRKVRDDAVPLAGKTLQARVSDTLGVSTNHHD